MYWLRKSRDFTRLLVVPLEADAPNAEVDVVADPLPERILSLGWRALAVVTPPGGHHLVIDGPHAHAPAGAPFLPVHRDRGSRIQGAHGDALRDVFELAGVDLRVHGEAIALVLVQVRQSVGEEHDIERRQHQPLPLE